MELLPSAAPELLGRQACWDEAARGKWAPRRLAMPLDVYRSEYPYQAADEYSTSAFRRRSAGACGSAAFRTPPAQCYKSTQRYEWAVEANESLSASQINQRSFCEAMARMSVRRLAVIGDSISWQMFVSLWKLLVPRSKPPHNHPHNMTIGVPCARAVGAQVGVSQLQTRQVQVAFLGVQDVHLDRDSAHRIAALVAGSDLTVLNFGSQSRRLGLQLAASPLARARLATCPRSGAARGLDSCSGGCSRCGMAWHGMAWQDKARQGKARHGKARRVESSRVKACV